MSHFIFNSVQKAEESIVQNGTYIVVLQAIRVPPHLLIAVNGKTWSISVSGQLPAEPIDKLFSYIHRKQIPTIFTELRLPSNVSADAFVAMLNDAVSRYPEVHANEVTCLHPIRDVASEVFGSAAASAGFIFELIPAIQKADGLGKHYGLYIQEYLDQNGDFAMQVYTAEDVARATEEATRQYQEGN